MKERERVEEQHSSQQKTQEHHQSFYSFPKSFRGGRNSMLSDKEEVQWDRELPSGSVDLCHMKQRNRKEKILPVMEICCFLLHELIAPSW
jgi:hypothetical protein